MPAPVGQFEDHANVGVPKIAGSASKNSVAQEYYRQIYLRLMPITGGPARVIACVYGGQGTINVPSWAPDSRRIAFVSDTDTVE